MSLALSAAAAEAATRSTRPQLGIGGLALAILLGLLVALVAFGGGREHS